MKRIFTILSLVVAFGIMLSSCQKSNEEVASTSNELNYKLGCELLPQDIYNKIPVAETPNVQFKATSLTLNTPAVGDQGSEGSCVAWGTTYAGRSIAWQAGHPASWSQSVNIFSPEYVYNQIKVSTCASGSYVTSGLDLLKSQGVCTWKSMPYTNGTCSVLPSATQKAEAANYKIAGYSRVTITAASIKAQLNLGKPVIVAGSVNNAFMYLANGAVLGSFKRPSLGGHCYCVVGYDDVKGAFKFQNSWGTTWASSGFGWIAYNNVGSWWSEAYVIN